MAETKTIRFTQSAGIDHEVFDVGRVEEFPADVADAIVAEGNAEIYDPSAAGEQLLEVSESEAVAALQEQLAKVEAERDAERAAREQLEATVAELQADASSASASDPSSADPAETAPPVEIPEKLPDSHAELVILADALGLPTRSGKAQLSKVKLAEAIKAKRAELAAS